MIAEAELLEGSEVPTGAELGRLQSVWSARAEQLQVCEGELNALDLESVGVEEYVLLLSRRDAARRLSEWAASRAEGYAARLEAHEQSLRDEYQGKLGRLKMLHEHAVNARVRLSRIRSTAASAPSSDPAYHRGVVESIPGAEEAVRLAEEEERAYREEHPEVVAEFDALVAEEAAEARRELDEGFERAKAEAERKSRNSFGW
jgi:hypothetical protein